MTDGMDQIRSRLSALQARLAGILKSRSEAANKHAAFAKTAETELAAATDRITQDLSGRLEAGRTAAQAQRAQLESHWNKRSASLKKSAMRKRGQLEEQMKTRRAGLLDRRKQLQSEMIVSHERKLLANEDKHNRNNEFLEDLVERTEDLKRRVDAFARDRATRLESKGMGAYADAPQDESLESAEKLSARLDAVEETLKKSQRLGPIIPLMAGDGIVLLLGAAAWFYFFKVQNPPLVGTGYHVLIGLATLVVMVIVHVLLGSSREKVKEAGTSMYQELLETAAGIQREKGRERERSLSDVANLGVERMQLEQEEENTFKKALAEFDEPINEAIAKLQERREQLLDRIVGRRNAALHRLDFETNSAAEKLRAESDASHSKLKEQHAAKSAAEQRDYNTTLEQLASAWTAELAQFKDFVEEVNRPFREMQASINSSSIENLKLPDKFPGNVPVAAMKLDLTEVLPRGDATGAFSLAGVGQIDLPILLSYPLRGSMLIRAGNDRRNDALQLTFITLLNLLRSFPPAKAKLTIIDPIGLGQSFAGLMHLADYDESLVNGRIWSDGAHIERKLTELTEHMEKVIQKYLRNRYTTIYEYNQEAGQMAEPYRFIVIGDFPAGFSELALERLASIIKSGVRCGVYTILIHAAGQKLPPQIEMEALRANGPAIVEYGTGLSVEEEILNHGRLNLKDAPTSVQIDKLVNAIGKQCRDAARVQVPFEVVMPGTEKEFWSLNTDSIVRVPLGKSGADRLQYMELGKGTQQHALIAGKTGSGKSNLFHVIVTNAASWYSPRELEFYLIDFKKGVEFKTYGTHRLRHARVVAIESDREFAISVLRRLDGELTRRGEAFRKVRVQDFGSFRKASPDTVMPRTLLLIDEFQEFFTDDDSVAQEAALLLDRIVRQGRAFGIHVVLGSQTLGGTYTLSKATLGQVVVRIALACNEADSYLVLSDDNAAAAALTRPGEAIYNDQAGAVEGNNPFQAVYLPKEVQDKHLSILQRRAVEAGLEAVEPLVVFEGNSLADIRNNMLLRTAALSAARPTGSTPRIWIGEPNAIKGPCEVEFGKQAGANLVVVGSRGDADIAMACAAILSLAAAHSPKDIKIKILDGTRPDAPARERLLSLVKALPHDIEVCDYRRTGDLITELNTTMKSRQDQSAVADDHIFFFVLGLEKFRMLRMEDEFSFSSGSDAASPSKGFTDLLTEGPNTGIHSIIWVDTLGNLNRSLSRKMLREFEMRVLFQMSESDSSELIDSPAANKLGMYNALSFSAQSGQIEKLRPYATPDNEIIGEFSRIITARDAREAKKAEKAVE